MPVAWYIGPYIRDDVLGHGQPSRFAFISKFDIDNPGLVAGYKLAEVLGNHGIAKVRAPDAVLDAIATLPGVDRFNKDRLDDSLADLTSNQKQRLKTIALNLGYTNAEINAAFPGDLGNYTVGDVFRFYGSRWRRPYWDGQNIQFESTDVAPPVNVDDLHPEEV